MVFLTLVQVEGNSLHTITLSRDCTSSLILLPLSGERRVRVQARIVLISTRLTMTLCVSANFLRSLVVEGNLIFIASRPNLVRSVDKELSIPFSCCISISMNNNTILSVRTTCDRSTSNITLSSLPNNKVAHITTSFHLTIANTISKDFLRRSLGMSDFNRLPINLTYKLSVLEEETITIHGRSYLERNFFIITTYRNHEVLFGATVPVTQLKVDFSRRFTFCLAKKGNLIFCTRFKLNAIYQPVLKRPIVYRLRIGYDHCTIFFKLCMYRSRILMPIVI